MQICDKDNVFPEDHVKIDSLWEPVNQPTPGLGSIEQVLGNFEQVFDQVENPAPGVEIPFLQQDTEKSVSKCKRE